MYIVLPMNSTSGLVRAAMQTDQGRIRTHNEDYVLQLEPTSPTDEEKNGWVYVVADGVGGADAGEVASQYASERAIVNFLKYDVDSWPQRVSEAMRAANADLRQLVVDRNDNSRMATTMVFTVLHDNIATIGNVGDSRAYHWRQGQFKQITKDQSLVAKLLEEGAITEEEALHHPRKNVILYSIGSDQNPQIDTFEVELRNSDILLMCSDGLTRHVTDVEIGDIISQEEPNMAAESLIQLANSRGGEDNISVAIIRYGPQRATAYDKGPVMVASDEDEAPLNSKALWVYTTFLAFVMSALILLVWLNINM